MMMNMEISDDGHNDDDADDDEEKDVASAVMVLTMGDGAGDGTDYGEEFDADDRYNEHDDCGLRWRLRWSSAFLAVHVVFRGLSGWFPNRQHSLCYPAFCDSSCPYLFVLT